MAKYNTKRENKTLKPITTHEGGSGFAQTLEKELIGLLSTGLANSFYESENERVKRLSELIKTLAQKDPLFVAKALIYARIAFGQRSVTHVGAVELLPYLSGKDFAKRFFSKRDRKENRGGIIYRLDDMAEILAYYQAKNGVDAPIPNSIKKGFKSVIENSDLYTLAKYQMKSRNISLIDIVNLVHPKETSINGTVEISFEEYGKAIKGTKFEGVPVNKNEKTGNAVISALRALILGLLKQFNTVEDKNTNAGKEVSEKVKSGEISEEEALVELNEAKIENFKELIESKKIGYLALLRNLRNILKTNDEDLVNKACDLLIDEQFICKSLVFPHQIDLALEVILEEFRNNPFLLRITTALNTAYELSIPNLSELFNKGRTAVVLDVSGSMSTKIKIAKGKYGLTSALDKGALIAATLAKGIGAEMFIFATNAMAVNYNPLDSINTIKKNLLHINKVGGGTQWEVIFPLLEEYGKFDRVFIISDEQGADSVEKTYKTYCSKFGIPHVFVINICGYGPTMIKENTRVHRIYGYNADIYETAKKVEIDIDAVLREIEKIEI